MNLLLLSSASSPNPPLSSKTSRSILKQTPRHHRAPRGEQVKPSPMEPTQGASEDHTTLQMRLGGYYTGALTANLVELGDRLGLYAGLKKHGPCSAADLAKALDLSGRYVLEWCRQQAAAKLISTDVEAETFWLTPVQADCLVNELGPDASPMFFVGGFSMLPGLSATAAKKLPALFASGAGIDYDDYDEHTNCGVCRELGVWVRHFLIDRLTSLPGVEARLEEGCMVADIGCGGGEAVLTAAAKWPNSTFHGYDISETALARAREEAERRGLTNASFLNPGVEEQRLPGRPTYALVMTHDAIHDMAAPGKVMTHVRKATLDDGCWVIGDMACLDSPGQNVHSHPLAPFLYGFSCHLCLPSGLSGADGEALGLGTMGISTAKMREMLSEAGFGKMDVLDWGHPLNRYYLARP